MVAAALPLLAGASRVLPHSHATRASLEGLGVPLATDDSDLASVDAVALLADELTAAGDHAEELLARLVADLRPRTLVVASARSVLAPGAGRGYRSDELRRALGHHGVDVELLCAPGAGGLAAGRTDAPYDAETDRLPGLLDAAPRLVVAGRVAATAHARSEAFFATLPRKVVAAAVVCRDDAGRLLVVHDTFQNHWTLPGGVVDAGEDPRAAAVREAWEEAGVVVEAGDVLGVFAGRWPDRLVLVYQATAVAGAAHHNAPVHAHEIDAVDWIPVEQALHQLAPHVAEQVRRCLTAPGRSWPQTG